MDPDRNVRVTARKVEQCFLLWRTRYGAKHKGSHCCIRDRGHEGPCLCSCGAKRKKEAA